MEENDVDFEVLFQPTHRIDATVQSEANFQSDLDNIVCSRYVEEDWKIPAKSYFKSNLNKGYNDIWGVSINGVPFQSAIDNDVEDNVYPRRKIEDND